MKKFIKLVVITLVFSMLLVGCNKNSESVSTDGSTSMEKVISMLGESFTNETDIAFTYNPTGSTSGIKAIEEGRTDIGLASRGLKDLEKESGLKETVLAYDGIAIIVHKDNPINNLSIEDITKIYKGEITNWKDLSGNDEEIVLIGREAGSGTRDGFESITKTKDAAKYRQELASTGDVITTVSTNPSAIGYASLSSVKDNIKVIKVNGVAPSEVTVKDGTYKIQRPFVLVTKEGKKLSPSAQKFFDYALSSEVNQIIIDSGLVPAN